MHQEQGQSQIYMGVPSYATSDAVWIDVDSDCSNSNDKLHLIYDELILGNKKKKIKRAGIRSEKVLELMIYD